MGFEVGHILGDVDVGVDVLQKNFVAVGLAVVGLYVVDVEVGVDVLDPLFVAIAIDAFGRNLAEVAVDVLDLHFLRSFVVEFGAFGRDVAGIDHFLAVVVAYFVVVAFDVGVAHFVIDGVDVVIDVAGVVEDTGTRLCGGVVASAGALHVLRVERGVPTQSVRRLPTSAGVVVAVFRPFL